MSASTQHLQRQALDGVRALQPPTIHTGEDPESIALDPHTQTLYTANQVSNEVSVIDASRCNATNTAAAVRRRPPSPCPIPARWPPTRPSQPSTSPPV